jgi:hypothetical protein
VVGLLWTSDDAFDEGLDVDNCVSWTMLENELEGDEIPTEVEACGVVEAAYERRRD